MNKISQYVYEWYEYISDVKVYTRWGLNERCNNPMSYQLIESLYCKV